jgi:Short C-terminal domain
VFGEKWETGTGTMVFAENKNDTKGSSTYRDTIVSNWVYVIEVTPPGQEAFRAKVSDYYHSTQLIGFHVGQTFEVLYDAKHKKIKWDPTDATVAARLTHKPTNTPASMDARLDAALHGEPPPATTDSPAQGDGRAMMAAMRLMRTDPEAGRAAIAAAGGTLQQFSQGPPPPDAVAATSSVDQLAKLADLKTQGVLTDEEFAAAKQKLLGV